MEEKNNTIGNQESERTKKITEMQYGKFGALHEFHTARTAEFLNALAEHFGDGVIEAASEVKVDFQDLIRWHLKRTADLLEHLQEKYGPEVMELINQKERETRVKSGEELSQNCQTKMIDDIIPYFGGEQNVVEKTDDHCVIRTQYCALANAAKEAGIEDFVYHLHCCNDPSFVEGFNPKLGCEVRKSMIHGDEYCEHYIYIK